MRPPGQARRAWRIHRCGFEDGPGLGAVDMYIFRRPIGVIGTHRFSCDSSKSVQRWIRKQCKPPPGLLFDDVVNVPKGKCMD
eukprot:7691533-Pyramimonas_sp.AAC.1